MPLAADERRCDSSCVAGAPFYVKVCSGPIPPSIRKRWQQRPTLCSTLAHLTPTACGVQVARAWWLVIDAYCGLCPHLSVLTRCQAERSRRALGMAASPEGISTDATQPMNRDSAAAMATKSKAKDRTGRSSGLLSGWLALGCEPNLRPPPAFVYLTRLVRMY